MAKQWRMQPAETARAAALAARLGVTPLLAELLIHRGFADPEAAERFLAPELAHLHPPALLPDLEAGLSRLIRALQGGERILIFGDYDADGVTAVSLMMRLLKPLAKGEILYYVPKRLEEGYGLSAKAVRGAASKGVDLILTVDCGISARSEVAAAKALGMDVIVTDHHEPGGTVPEDAAAVIDPKLPGSRYPFPELAGVGLAFKLGQALAERGLIAEAELMRYLDLVAIGTIADVVPLVDENRVLARHGLARLNRTEHPGLKALLEVARLGEKEKEITAGQVGFVIAPRLNATGRLGDAMLGVKLLLAGDMDKGRKIAKILDKENEQRQRVEADLLREAQELLARQANLEHDRAVVLASEGWHPGVIGIVASRLAEALHRPAILIALEGEEGRGSGRSIPGFHLYQGLSRCAFCLERFGGHEAAAGLTVRRDRVGEFARAFIQVAREEIGEEMLQPTLRIEAEVPLAEVDLRLAREIQRLSPYGQGNPAPVLACRAARILSCRGVGENNKHLRIRVAHHGSIRDGIGFNLGTLQAEAGAAGLVDLAFTVEENNFNGKSEVQLNLRDLVCYGENTVVREAVE